MNNRKITVNFLMHPHDSNIQKHNHLMSQFVAKIVDDPQLSSHVRVARWNMDESKETMEKWQQKRAGGVIAIRAVHTPGQKDAYAGHSDADDILRWVEGLIAVDAQVLAIFALGKDYLKIVDEAGTTLNAEGQAQINEIIEQGKVKMEDLRYRQDDPDFQQIMVDQDHLAVDGRFVEAFLKHMKKFARILSEKKIPVREQMFKEKERLTKLSNESENMKKSKIARVITRLWALQWLSIGKGEYGKIQEETQKVMAEQEAAKKAEEERQAAIDAEKQAEEEAEREAKAKAQKVVDEADDLSADWEGNVVEDHPAVPQMKDDEDQLSDLADNDAEEVDKSAQRGEY